MYVNSIFEKPGAPLFLFQSFLPFRDDGKVTAFGHLDDARDDQGVDNLGSPLFDREETRVVQKRKVLRGDRFVQFQVCGKIANAPGLFGKAFKHGKPVRVPDGLKEIRGHGKPVPVGIVHIYIVAMFGNFVKFFCKRRQNLLTFGAKFPIIET